MQTSFPVFSRVVNRKMYALEIVSELLTTEPEKLQESLGKYFVYGDRYFLVIISGSWIQGVYNYIMFYILIIPIVMKHCVQQFL